MRFTFYFCVIALGYSILVSCNTIDGIVSESNEKGFVVIIIF